MSKPDVVTVAVSRVDGGVTVLRVVVREYVRGVVHREYDPTPAYVNSLIAKYAWEGSLAPTSWRFVPNDYVDDATDKTFRNAWKDGGSGKPDVDMPKAREIHRERLRRLRAPMMEALDVEYMRADELNRPQDKQAIAARKQALRDVTADPAIEAAPTPEALKAVIPEALRG